MDTIRHHARASVLTPTGTSRVAIDTELVYRADDPYAVHLDLTVDGGETVTWTFGRGLLAAGLDVATGEGDVRLQPLDDDELLVELHSAAGYKSDVLLDASAARQFVANSYQLVPAHCESEWLDIDFDAELQLLLGAC
jgi:hypothetical protein